MYDDIQGQTIAVWFSCGAASAVAAKLIVDKYSSNNIVKIVNNPIKEEDEDNRRFLRDVEQWIGVPIETAVNSKYPNASCKEVWDDRKFMSGVLGAPCTLELKKFARQQWEKINNPDYHVLGFTLEEKTRHEKFILTERSNVIPILINEGITKNDCYLILQNENINLPNIYKRGYPNANCIGCVKATSPTYWNLVRNKDPDVFQERAEQSRRIGAKLVRYKGKRIFLDELPLDAKGKPLKSLDFECGIFCEEKS
tara:strand:- start:363 stop:1124 length:762 start_codon:yes stop_codon:yes gene_type:complete